MGMTRNEMITAAEALFEEITSKGESESSVAELFGWDEATYGRVRARMLELKTEQLRARPREHAYVEFVIQQQRNIRDLDDVIKKLDKTKMHAASIGAIRLRSDLQTAIIEKGQEFGLIKKEAERREIVAGVVVADMSRTELSIAIAKELTGFKGLMEKFGDAPITSIVPLGGASLHYGEAATPYIDAESDSSKDQDAEVPAPVKPIAHKPKKGRR
jgi:hypothetical protein